MGAWDAAKYMLIDTEVLRAALLTPTAASSGGMQWGLRLAYEGPPGVAKTAMVYEVAYGLGLHVHVLRASQMDPTDVAGLLVPREIDGRLYTDTSVPLWAKYTHDRSTLVFADELTAGSSEAVMASLLGVVQDHQVGQYALGPRTRMIAAYNPQSCAAGGMTIPPPMANRLVHVPVLLDAAGQVTVRERDKSAWADWFLTAADDFTEKPAPDESILAPLESAVLAKWATAHAAARSLIYSFVTKVPSLGASDKSGPGGRATSIDSWYHMPAPEDDQAIAHGWNSARSLDVAARCMATAEIHGLTADQEEVLIRGTAGDTWARKFAAWRTQMDIPSGEEFIDGKKWKKWRFDKRADRTFAVLINAANFVLSRPSREEQVARLPDMVGALLRSAKQVGSDSIVRPFRHLSDDNLVTNQPGESGPKSPYMVMRPLMEYPGVAEFIAAIANMGK